MAVLDLSKLSFEELQNLPADDAPVTPRAQPVDTGLHPAHNQIEMFDPSEIKMPDRTGSLSPNEIAKTAQYQAQQEAYSLQQAGTPLNREQYKKLVNDSYDQIFKLNTPRTPEEELKFQQEQLSNLKAKQEIGLIPQKLAADKAIELSAAQSSFSALDQLETAHADNVKAHRPGFGPPLSGQAMGNADWTPEGAAYVGLSEGSLPLFSKAISGQTGPPSDADMKSARMMMINPGDRPETVHQKVLLFKEKILSQQDAKLTALEASGYDVSGLRAIHTDLSTKLKTVKGIPADAAADVNLNDQSDAELARMRAANKAKVQQNVHQ